LREIDLNLKEGIEKQDSGMINFMMSWCMGFWIMNIFVSLLAAKIADKRSKGHNESEEILLFYPKPSI